MTVVAVTYPDKLYIGTQNLEPFDPNSPPLAFAIDATKDTAAFKKQQQTVKDWCREAQGPYNQKTKKYDPPTYTPQKPVTIQNLPQKGMKLAGFASRWSTSNKLIRVTDPRGFQLEISIENLVELLKDVCVIHGVIDRECVWGRAGGKVYLTTLDHPSYKQKTNPVREEKSTLKVGDIVKLPGQSENCVFLGKAYALRLGGTRNSHQNPLYQTQNWEARRKLYESGIPEYTYSYKPISEKHFFDVFHIFGYVDTYGKSFYMARRKPTKFTVIKETTQTKDFLLERNKIYPVWFNDLPTDNGVSFDHATFFADKDELENFDVKDIEKTFESHMLKTGWHGRDIKKVESWTHTVVKK